MRPPLSLPLAPPGDAPSAFVIFVSENTKIQVEQATPKVPPFTGRAIVRVTPFPPPTLLPCVFGCSPSWRGLPPDHASFGGNGNAAIRPSSGAAPQPHQFVCAVIRDAPLVKFQAPITIQFSDVARYFLLRVLRARGTHAPKTCNTLRSGKHRRPTQRIAVAPAIAPRTASPRFLARLRQTGLKAASAPRRLIH